MRRSIFSYRKDKKWLRPPGDLLWTKIKDELIWKSDWGSEMSFSHCTIRQKGVCIRLNPSTSNLLIESLYSDVDGHIVLVNITFNSLKASLFNIYAPSNLTLLVRCLITDKFYIRVMAIFFFYGDVGLLFTNVQIMF